MKVVLHPSPEVTIHKATKDSYRGKVVTEKGYQRFWFSEGSTGYFLRVKGDENQKILAILEGQIGKPRVSWKVSNWFSKTTLHFWPNSQQDFETFIPLLYRQQKEGDFFGLAKTSTIEIRR